MREWSPRWQTAIILALLAAAAIIPYWQVRHFEFITFDDRFYVWDNPVVRAGLTWKGVQWAFTALYMSNWHPLTWLSHMLDCEMFWRGAGSQWPGGHHLVNVFFHAFNTMLLFWLFRIMTGAMWRSALVAALFALHPLHVESVAWVAERKDVLSTFFGLLAMLAYVRYTKRPGLGRYAVVAALFACSLLSKPMLVTLPFVLLLLDYWPLNRVTLADSRLWRVALEKVPLLVMSAASSVITVMAQQSGDAIYSLVSLPIQQRVLNAVVAYAMYLKMTIWPSGLAVLYPRPDSWPPLIVMACAVVLVGITALALRLRKSHPHVMVGWLWYLGTLVPVVGLVQVGYQLLADRYTYVPLIGIFIMIAWSIPAATRFAAPGRVLTISCISAALMVCAALTVVQIGHWRDSESLFRRALAVTERNLVAHYNLGYVLRAQQRNDEAIEQFRACVTIEPRYAPAHDHLANALAATGQFEEAVDHYRRAIELFEDAANPSEAYNNLGTALVRLNRLDEALSAYEQSIARNPDNQQVHFNRGEVLLHLRRYEEAADSYRRALQLDGRMAAAHVGLGRALAVLGQIDEALRHFDQALMIDPNDQEALLYKQRVSEAAQRLMNNP